MINITDPWCWAKGLLGYFHFKICLNIQIKHESNFFCVCVESFCRCILCINRTLSVFTELENNGNRLCFSHKRSFHVGFSFWTKGQNVCQVTAVVEWNQPSVLFYSCFKSYWMSLDSFIKGTCETWCLELCRLFF